MGLFKHRVEAGRRYQMRQRMLSIGDDYWIEDDAGVRAFRVNGKVARIRDTWVLEAPDGQELARIRERKLSIRDAVKIEIGGEHAVVKKALIGFRDRFNVELERGHDVKVRGNIVDHEYEIEQDGVVLGTVSKKWFRIRDTYGVEVSPMADPVLVLAISVAVDALAHD